MQENAATTILDRRPPAQQKETPRPAEIYLDRLRGRFKVEIDSLIGLNALTRPYKEQQLTVAEKYYGFRSPAEVMEVNRTVMNVWLFDLVHGEMSDKELQDAYEGFAAAQNEKGKLHFDEFCELKALVDEAVPTDEADRFRAMLIYGDLGKSTRMQEYMQQRHDKVYADHDKLLVDVLDDEDAIRHCMPSFLEFSVEDQAYMRACFKSGFHLGQYQKLETLPVHLQGIQRLPKQQRDIIMLSGLFDIAGALGDKVQSGTPILDSHTFQTFKKARESVHSVDADAQEMDPAEQALFSYEWYMAARNEEFGFDLNTAKGRALARFVSMFRVMKPDEIAGVSKVFDSHLNEITQELFMSLLDATGHENNALWVEYGPALARNIYATMVKSKCSFEEAMATSMTILARIANSARREMAREDRAREPATVLAVSLAHIAGDAYAWHRLLREDIRVTRKSEGEYTAELVPVPHVEITSENRMEDLSWLKNNEGTTLFIGVGGGSDSEFARYAADVLASDVGAPVVSFPGVASENVRHATRITDLVYKATTNTYFEDMRSFEGLSAKTGPCYIVVNVERGDQEGLVQAYRDIASDLAASTGKPVSRIVTVDSGGDILVAPTKRWNRDHASLDAAIVLENELAIAASHTLVFPVGPGAPSNLSEVLQYIRAGIYQPTRTELEAFRRVCEENKVPTHATNRYSQLLNISWLAVGHTLEHFPDAVQPLRLPLRQVLKNNRPAYGAISRSMTNVLVVENSRLREYHRSSI